MRTTVQKEVHLNNLFTLCMRLLILFSKLTFSKIILGIPSDCQAVWIWFKHILLAKTVDIIKQMLTIVKLQGLERKQHGFGFGPGPAFFQA